MFIKEQIDMKKKEYAVGEVFQCGLLKFRVSPAVDKESCKGCYFNFGACAADVRLLGSCSALHRKDKTEVIFVKVED